VKNELGFQVKPRQANRKEGDRVRADPPSYWLGLGGLETYFILHTYLPMKMEQSVPKRRHVKFRRRELPR
jgi:hypothetical protein